MNFTPEQKNKLELYLTLLKKWQSRINLVSKKTIEDAWERHIIDSAQLIKHIPPHAKKLTDIGSGAGFPGLVLAVLRPDLSVTLIESDQRKCVFLHTVSRETDVPVTIINDRIEDTQPPETDVMSARALASLTDLLSYTTPFYENNPDLICLFLKGQRADKEISEAQKKYKFNFSCLPSETNQNAHILKISFM